MSNFNVSDYMQSPLDVEQKRQRNEMLGYQNMLAKQAMEDEQQQRAGYQAAYQNMLAQQAQQQQPQETVQPTDALAKLGYGDFQYQPEAQPQQQMPYQPPQGASYGHIKGAEQANALFQKQQVDYYSQNVAPLMEFFIKSGDNDSFQKLIIQVSESTNPVAGMAKQFASMVQGVNITNPGKLDNVKMTEELRPVLLGMAEETPALKAWIASVPTGQHVSVNVSQGKITGGAEAKAVGSTALQIKKVQEQGPDGKIYEVTYQFNPQSGEKTEIARAESSSGRKQRYAKQGEAGAILDRWTGKIIYPERDKSGKLSYPEISAEEAQELGVSAVTQKSAARQAGGPKAASLYRGLELFKDTAPKLISLKETLAQEDRSRLLPLVTSSKTWNELSGKLALAVEDNPNLTDLYKSTTLLADSLAAVYGAGTGGQWSFEVAKQMLDPNIPIESFKRTLASHQHKLEGSYESSQKFPTAVKPQSDVRKEQTKMSTEYQVGDSYKGKKIVRLGWFGKSRVALLEGGKQVEIK